MLHYPFKRLATTCRGTGGVGGGWTIYYCGDDCMVTLGPGGRSVASEGVDHVKINWYALMFKDFLRWVVLGAR
jgi:hypothetical protein